MPDGSGDNYISAGWISTGITYPSATQQWTLQFGDVVTWQNKANGLGMNVYMSSGQSATFTVELTSTCVIVTEWYIFTADGYYSYYSVAPNPVNSDLTIYVDDEKLKTKKIKRLPSRVFKR
jgi:hypothetical protein